MARYRFSDDQAGFSLVEVMVATTILAVGLVSLAQLFGIATTNNVRARNSTYASVLAEQKMEQLRSLTWGFDVLGLPLTDVSTNTAASVDAANGGTGLSPSPADALRQDTDGYVDYVDRSGNILGGGTTPPLGTVYIRRWSIEPLPTNPNNTVILQVLVTRQRDRGDADLGTVLRLRDEARLISVKTRKST